MNLDSIKIKMELENLDFDKSKYWTQIKINPDDNSEQTKFVLCKKDTLGLKQVEILPTTNEVLVELSAKILKEDYLQGINENTVERVHGEIKPLISCSFDELINATVLRTDITENLMFNNQQEKENAICSLKLGKSNTAFKVDDYTDKRESIIFTGRQVSYKNRQIYYNKEKELLQAKNKYIMQHLQKQYKDISKILRVEQNITTFDKLRQAIGKDKVNTQLVSNFRKSNINSVKLYEMLTSKEKPLYNRHCIITKYANEVNLFDEYETFDDALFDYGIKGLLVACNSSQELLLDFFDKKTRNKYYDKKRNKRSGHYYELRKKILFHLSNNIMEKSPKSGDLFSYFETLKTIEVLLKAA